MKIKRWFFVNINGILLSFALAVVSFFLGKMVPLIGGAVFGIVIGMIIGNTLGIHEKAKSGLGFASRKILQAAIIILGCTLSLSQVYDTGMSSLNVMMFPLVSAFISAYALGKILNVSFNLTSLIGMGTAICGGSAIAAIAPIIDAENKDIAYSISAVFLFNVVAVLIFPPIGAFAGFTQNGFGLWAGTAINDTSSVVAAAYSYGTEAGGYATIVKLARTTMIIPVALFFAVAVSYKNKKKRGPNKTGKYSFVKIFPWFILFFLAGSLLNTVGLFSKDMVVVLTETGKFLIILSLSAIGLNSDFKKIRDTGFRPLLLGFVVWAVVASVSVLVQMSTGRM